MRWTACTSCTAKVLQSNRKKERKEEVRICTHIVIHIRAISQFRHVLDLKKSTT